MVASDHSPSPIDLKTGADFFGAWGGISGFQTVLSLILSEAHHAGGMSLARIAEITAGFPARRFGLAGKGRLEVGADADLPSCSSTPSGRWKRRISSIATPTARTWAGP